MRQVFDRQMQKIQEDLLSLGSMVEGAILDGVQILYRRDISGSYRLIDWDQRVNERRFVIEQEVLSLIVRQQPVARDMRMLAAILELVAELERMGDYAKGIARINLLMRMDFPHQPFIGMLIEMGELAAEMVRGALEAFAGRDVALARKVPAQDQTVDALYQEIYRRLISYVVYHPADMDQANYILWVAHNLERTADRAVNICERVVFMVTGEMVELAGDENKQIQDNSPPVQR